jgi:hypothetical protein
MKDAYSREFLIGKYPHLKKEIELGYFTITLDERGRKVITFTNTAIFAADFNFQDRLVDDVFPSPDISRKNIISRSTLIGIEIRER